MEAQWAVLLLRSFHVGPLWLRDDAYGMEGQAEGRTGPEDEGYMVWKGRREAK